MSKIFVSLGRYGDLINILPVLKHEHDSTGQKVRLAVARLFSSVLDGCSYIEPIILDVSYEYPARAITMLRGMYPDVAIVNCQAWGLDIPVPMHQNDFCREMWAKSFSHIVWGSEIPVFDNRNAEREMKWISMADGSKPLLIVNTSGHSAKWHTMANFVTRVREALPEYDVFDISEIKAERIYDLLGLFERAKCLLTIDSAPLHLAAALPNLPIIALIPNRTDYWCVAPWRKQHIKRVLYNDVDKRFNEIIYAVRELKTPRIFHVWCDWRETVDDRNKFARNTWPIQGLTTQWIDREFKRNDCFRDSVGTIGDTRAMPYIRDMLDHACAGVEPNDTDIICITNADIGLPPDTGGKLIDACHKSGSCYAHRWDSIVPFKRVPNREAWTRLHWYDGCDCFAFTTKWWADNRIRYPDMLLGCECWDGAMRHLIRLTGGTEIEKAIFHQRHASFWMLPQNFRKNAGNVHNCVLYSKFLKENNVPWNNCVKK